MKLVPTSATGAPIHRRLDRHHPTRFRRRGGAVGALIACLVVLAVIGGLGYAVFFGNGDGVASGELIVEQVSRGPFDHIVLEQGEIESSSNIEVDCKVKSSSSGAGGISILWVIEEGTRVQEGDKLVELDSSNLELKLNEDKIRVIAAEANVTTAKALLEQAKIAKQEYLEGVYMTEETAIVDEKYIAEEELVRAQRALASSQRLVAKGVIKSLQLEADKFAVAKARNALKAAEGRLNVLQNLTRRKMLVQLESEIEKAQAQLTAYESELLEEQTQLADTKEQIKNCIITAPAAGVVVHANRYSSRGGNAEFVVEAGATVRERQALVRLPDPSKMQVKSTVNESRITLIKQGMAVKIAVDAIPGLSLKGRVTKVNRYAQPGGFGSSGIKEYAVFIDILDPPEVIRTGMTAEVQIFVEQLDEAIQMSVEGLYEHGNKMYSLIQEGPDQFRTSEVTIGATNDTMATITEGVKEGETIVLNLREHLDLMDLPDVTVEDNSDMRKIADVDPNAKAVAPEKGPPGGGRPGGFGGPGGGGPPGGGGGMPDPSFIVDRIMERADTDGDGKISAEEVQSAGGRSKDTLTKADTNGDGAVDRAELLNAMKKRMGT